MTPEVATERPVAMMESGPVGGIIASAQVGHALGFPNVISFDMGGTTAKASLIRDGEPTLAPGYYVGGYASGHPVMLPMIDVVEVGAGGGRIAWIDDVGALKVGPQSAGADPGPICYRGGGTEPTITDANVVLGRLDPDNFLGGKMKLDADGARARHRGEDRRAAQARHRRGGAGDRRDRDHQDVARGARGLGRQGLRPARLRAGRLRRRRPAARLRDRARAAHPDRDRAAVSRRISRRSACCSPTSATISSAPSIPTSPASISRTLVAGPRRDGARRRTASLRHAQGRRAPDPARSALRRPGVHPVGAGDARAAQGAATARRSAPRSTQLYEHRYAHHSPDEPVEMVNIRLGAHRQARRRCNFPQRRAARRQAAPAGERKVYFGSAEQAGRLPGLRARRRCGAGARVAGPGADPGARHHHGAVRGRRAAASRRSGELIITVGGAR